MANVKISELPLGTPNSTSIFPFVDEGTTYRGAFSAITANGGVTQVTYSQLYNRITGGTLNAGNYYQITDYRTCYDQPDYDNTKTAITTGIYKSADTVSPIVVFATSANTISVDAFQPEFPFDKIKYDYSFNNTEHTAGPAFGRITERIDNFNNRTDYDHRTILFKRYIGYSFYKNEPLGGLVGISGITGTTGILYGNTGTTFNSNMSPGSFIAIDNLTPKFFEVISVESDYFATISGVTITETSNSIYYSAFDDGIMSYHQPNVRANEVFEYTTFGDALADGPVVNNYIGDQANLYLENNTGEFLLANNVFLTGSFLNNRIGNGSYNNTFNDDCDSNQIGDSFYNNSTNDDFDGNIIGDFFSNNYITGNFNNNRIGSDFDNNILIGGTFYRNNIGNDFTNNVWTNNDFQNNEIGNQFNNNNIYDDFYKNDIGNGYNNNDIYSNFIGNLIGNGWNGNNIYGNLQDNVIGDYFENNIIGISTNIGSISFRKNNIGYRFGNNTITGSSFSENRIGPDFSDNIIGDVFDFNEIGPNFNSNNIYGEFYKNDILDNFNENNIYGVFQKNRILNDFNTCTIGDILDLGGITFQSNEIMNNFKGNNIIDNFSNNRLKTDFKGNELLGEFSYNNVGYSCIVNNFSGQTVQNTIGDYFQFNNCYGSLSYNTIGAYFYSNEVQDGFGVGGGNYQGNRIGNNFYDNNIGEYFYNNTIPDNFYNNTIGDSFQWNMVDTYVDNIDFTTYYGNITAFTYTATGNTATDGTYNALGGITTAGNGENATFDVLVSGGVVEEVSLNAPGNFYLCGNTITISGTQIGGTNGVDNIVISVGPVSPTPSVYQAYTCNIFKRAGLTNRLSYYDANDILTIKNINE